MTTQVIQGDCREVLATLPAESVQCCVTSPPYYGLRDYGTGRWEGGDPTCDHRSPTMREGRNEDRAKLAGSAATNAAQLLLAHRSACGKCGAVKADQQIGLEQSPQEYVEQLVAVFREVWRVLRKDGTLWLNLGDSYATQGGRGEARMAELGRPTPGAITVASARGSATGTKLPAGLKPKDLMMIPARVALALQADGWWVRSDIIWHKPNPMPESIRDRPTSAHEHIFLLTKAERYFYDAAAIAEPCAYPDGPNAPDKIASPHGQGFTRRAKSGNKARVYAADFGRPDDHLASGIPWEDTGKGRNARNVWSIATCPYPEAHFATFPPELAERCIKAGSRVGDTVLDPFAGAGTTLLVADRLQRHGIGIELNPEYVALARRRLTNDAPLFAETAA